MSLILKVIGKWCIVSRPNRYHFWKNRYILTGNLRAFEHMQRHYFAESALATPIGKRRAEVLCRYPTEEICNAMGGCEPRGDGDLKYIGKQGSINIYSSPKIPYGMTLIAREGELI